MGYSPQGRKESDTTDRLTLHTSMLSQYRATCWLALGAWALRAVPLHKVTKPLPGPDPPSQLVLDL